MRAVPLTPEHTSAWDALVSRSDDAWLFHLSDWIRIEEASARSVSFLVELEGGIAGVFPLYLDRRHFARFLPIRVLHTGRARAGPALAPELSPRIRDAVYTFMLAHAGAIAQEHRVDRLEIRLPTLAPAFLPPLRPQVSPLSAFGPFSPLKYAHTLERTLLVDKIVRLDQTEESLWMAMDDDCRKAVRKARKNGVVVTAAQSRQEMVDYHHLHQLNYGRTGARALPLRHFEALWDSFQARGFVQVFFAEHEGRRIAAILLLCHREAVTYWAGSSDAAFQHLRPNNLLMWHAMVWAREQGNRWFELGPTFPTAPPESKVRRIGRFKDQFGGEEFYAYEGAMDYRPMKIAGLELLDTLAAGAASRLRGWRRPSE